MFVNFRDVDERHAAFSYASLVPAALMGLDVNDLLARSLRMQDACRLLCALIGKPGSGIGSVLGELALHGRNKVTFLLPKSLAAFGSWLARLLGDNSSQERAPLIPIVGEPLLSPADYGDDRLFVYIYLRKRTDADLERAVAALCAAGQPLVTVEIYRPVDLGQEFFRWQMAAATAGAIFGTRALGEPANDSVSAQ